MGSTQLMIIVAWLLNQAWIYWEKARQIGGEDAIPSWEELTSANARTQAKIDAEKEE